MTTPLWHILLIDDSADDRADLRQMLLRGGRHRYRFSEAELGAEGVRMALDPRQGPFDCVLLDYALPDMDAPEVLAALCRGAEMPPWPVVVITGAEFEDGLALLGAGTQDHIGKRWTSADSLRRAVENAIERFALQQERQRTQAALRLSEARYRALFNSIDIGYAVLEMIHDPGGVAIDARYIEVNAAFERQSGLQGVVGRTARDLVPGVEDMWLDTYASVASTGTPVRMERYGPSMQRWFDVYAFRLGEPQARQVAVLFSDTTERKRVESALIAAQSEAETANRAKSDFLLSMSHELRSPLSSMLGYAQLIEAGTPRPTPVQQDSIAQILHAGWYLLGLINEILDLTTIESGRVPMASESVSLEEVLADCEAMVALQAQGSGIRLAFPQFDGPCLVQADPVRTKQVLINLLTNAIKYNRAGGRVEVRCAAAPGQAVRVSVDDTGAGLSAAQIAQLFQPFNRLDQTAGPAPGTGLGLMICKRLVELMGGRIGVDSRPGAGSCFWFELAAAEVAAAPAAILNLPARTVLYVEADADRRQRIEELAARRPGVNLLRAPDVRRAIQAARSARPDVILMSLQLPDASAAQAMQWLAKDPATALIPVIALGAEPVFHEGETGLAPGFFGHLAQPVQGDAFAQALDRAFQRNQAVGWNAIAGETR